MINWQFFPKSDVIPEHLLNTVVVFENCFDNIDSANNEHKSDAVLEYVRPGLEELNYKVEKSKRFEDKIHVPVLFGRNGQLDKHFQADGLNKETKTVIEVEAGRGVTNHQFLKDLFQACMMHDIDYLVIAVRNRYRRSNDFEKVYSFMDTLYASNRITLPLKGILIIGY
jgi:hypothetical protein